MTSGLIGILRVFTISRARNRIFDIKLCYQNINNVYFDNMLSQIYPSEPKINKSNTSDKEATFLDLHLPISNDIVSTKNYD